MAIYHFSAKMISRANGSSALAAAAYRSASRLHDQRLDRHHDFSNKAGVVHSEVMLPDGAPEHLADREELWNEVEAAEKRKDAQLAREIEFAIPRELDKPEGDPAGARLRRARVRRPRHDRRSQCALGHRQRWRAQAARACDADHARGRRGRVRREGPRLEPHRSAGALARGAGASTSTRGWPSSISMRGSITAVSKRRASTSSRSTRSGLPHRGWRGRGSRPSGWTSTTQSRAPMARRSSRTQALRSMRSPTARRPSPPATWRGSCTATATGRSSSTR